MPARLAVVSLWWPMRAARWQMATAVEEQSHVSEDINRQISRIADLSDHSSAQARRGSELSRELEGMADYLHDLTARFNR